MQAPINVNTPHLGGNELKYITESLESGWISSEGPFVKKFEEKFSQYVGKRFGIAVANGSGALDIAVQALEIGRGDEVIMPTFTIISPALSVVRAGATPVFVDSIPGEWTMDISQIERKITARTRAILVVHVYGIPADMMQIRQIADKYQLPVIEDAAEMIGQQVNGKSCGSFGDISIFSFYANKHVTTGEGGMLLTDDPLLGARCSKLRNLAFETNGPRFVHEEMGWNYRMTNLQAALGLAQLEQIDQAIERKKQIGAFYQQHLSILTDNGFQLPVTKGEQADNIYWVFGILAPDESSLQKITAWLSTKKIGWRPFFWCMHEQPVFRKMGLFENQHYPVAESLARRGFYIPSGLGLTQADQSFVCEALDNFFR